VPKYVVVLEARNVWVESGRDVAVRGGFANRVIRAGSAPEAGAIAEQTISQAINQDTLNPASNLPLFRAVEVHLVSRFYRGRDTGLIFFDEINEDCRTEARSMAREIAGL
jgi:hypothetical protein